MSRPPGFSPFLAFSYLKRQQKMIRLSTGLIPLIALTAICGCEPATQGENPQLSAAEPAAAAPQEASAFRLDDARHVIYLDTRIAPGQRRRFDIGQGSISLETMDVKDGTLTFRYTPEVEGGYTVYECTAPVGPAPVEFKINPDGTPGETSFDLKKCKVIRSGNLLLE
jgi:hypothetical protein